MKKKSQRLVSKMLSAACLQGRRVGEGGASREHALQYTNHRPVGPVQPHLSQQKVDTGGGAQGVCTLLGASTG